MEDFDTKIGRNVGKFRLGDRNTRRELLLQFAIDNDLTITNTMFKHHKRQLSIWTAPGVDYHNQIDYVLIRTRW